MEGAAPYGPAGQRHVNRLGGQAQGLNLGVQLRASACERRLDRLSDLVGNGTDAGTVLGWQRSDAAQHGRQIALLAEVLDLQQFKGRRIRRLRNLFQGPLLQAPQVGTQAFENLEPPTPSVASGTLSSFRTGTSRGLAVPPRFRTIPIVAGRSIPSLDLRSVGPCTAWCTHLGCSIRLGIDTRHQPSRYGTSAACSAAGPVSGTTRPT